MTLPTRDRDWKNFTQAFAIFRNSPIRRSEIPIEFLISLPMPTLRWGKPVWTCFAAPTVIDPGQNRIGLPDRWCAVDALTGSLAAYVMEDVIPAARVTGAAVASKENGTIDLGPVLKSVDEQQRDLARLAQTLDRLCASFFEGRSLRDAEREEIAAALAAKIPEPLMPFYNRLSPDFFDWIGIRMGV